MSATETKIKSRYKGDKVIVTEPFCFPEVWMEVWEGEASVDIHFTPKQARRLAKALKKAARKAEG